MNMFAHGSTYTPGKLRLLTTLWVARRSRPFAIVEDPEFIEIVTMFNNKASIPSRRTVSRDVQEVFQTTQGRVSTMLQVCLFVQCCSHVDNTDRLFPANCICLSMAGPLQTCFPLLEWLYIGFKTAGCRK
jgi:hypothetical protein